MRLVRTAAAAKMVNASGEVAPVVSQADATPSRSASSIAATWPAARGSCSATPIFPLEPAEAIAIRAVLAVLLRRQYMRTNSR
jgi:hypothetical protein